MNTCKECKWWKTEEEYDSRTCRKLNETKGQVENRNASITCRENIYTGPDFGCIHWKAEEAEA
jgi:hypothetical protein